MKAFSRGQLLDPDYNPLDEPEGPRRNDLERRYGLGSRRVNLGHAAAVRGILISEGKREWRWIWDWCLLRDEMVQKHGYDRLHARYRNQYTFMPTIEFEGPPLWRRPFAPTCPAGRPLPENRPCAARINCRKQLPIDFQAGVC